MGSGAQAFNTGQGLNNLATDIYGGAYQQDQNRQLSAAQSAAQNTIGIQQSAAQGLASNYNSLLGSYGTANSIASGDSNAAALQDYGSIVSPYLGLNGSQQQNTSDNKDNTGSFSNDLGYVSSIASIAGAFA